MDALLEDTAGRILSDHRNDPALLWASLEENGLTRLWVNEADGGFGLGAADGFGLVRLAGRHAAPVPLAETLIATWLLTETGIPVPPGPAAIFFDGFQRGIAFGTDVPHIVRIHASTITLHAGPAGAAAGGIGDDPLGDASTIGDAMATGSIAGDDALAFAALARAAQICGALEAALDLTISFAEQRVQFGRPLSKFQAIQHLLSEMAGEAAAAIAALDAAVATVQRGGGLDRMAIAVAKYRASLAAGIVAEHAHQVHGAIGYTHEYELGRLTRRLWQWREDFGGETYWAITLGNAALAEPGPLWPQLAGKGKAA